jgi:transcriptional regulator with XRE-family HTH domain
MLGQALMRLRADAGASDAELAVRLDVEIAFIRAIEAGEVNLRWQMVMNLLGALGVTIGDLASELDDGGPQCA